MQKVEDLAASRSEKSKPVSAFGATTRPPRFTRREFSARNFHVTRATVTFLIPSRWKLSRLAFTLHGNVS